MQVSEAAVSAVAAWVASGGQLELTAGAAQLNEYNGTNAATQRLVAVKQHGLWTGTRYSRHNATIFFIKQELPFAEQLDEVTPAAASPSSSSSSPPVGGGGGAAAAVSMGVFGEKSVFEFTPAPSDVHTTTATFKDGSPAQVTVKSGKVREKRPSFYCRSFSLCI